MWPGNIFVMTAARQQQLIHHVKQRDGLLTGNVIVSMRLE
jgi:hypothetical protein